MNSKYNGVFDASPLIALLYQEPGHTSVENLVEQQNITINTVNLAEVASVLSRDGMTQSDIRESLLELKIDIVPVNVNVALRAASLITDTKQYGLSLGDRVCLAFAESLKLPVYTTDKQWAKIQQFLSIPIKFVR